MSIEQKIKTAFLEAYKQKNMDLKNFLGILKGEIDNLKKNMMVDELSDSETIKYLGKFQKTLKENIQLTGDEKYQIQLDVVESFLPKELTKEEINQKLDELIISGVTTLGEVMKAFSTLSVDRKVLSEIAKEKLQPK
ncbi:hypothetical protein EBU94_06450 [bacterium]|nr:hypothetical protein [bacterium]